MRKEGKLRIKKEIQLLHTQFTRILQAKKKLLIENSIQMMEATSGGTKYETRHNQIKEHICQ